MARITGVFDQLDIAERVAQTLLSFPFNNPIFALSARAGLGMQAVLRHDAAEATEYYSALEKVRGSLYFFVFSGDRLLGLLAHTMGNMDQAAVHFEDALAFCLKAEFRPELAWTCCDYADTLLQRNEPGDREKAMSMLDESLAISSQLGMRPLMERVLSRRDILKA